MAAEGVVLLYELHNYWKPEKCASFYSFCVMYLPLRLIKWWRREMRQRNLAHYTGSGYVYHGRVSLDGTSDVQALEGDGENSRLDRALVTSDSHRLGD